MSLARIAWFIITNLPTLIKFAKDIVQYFDGDAKLVRECVGELCKAPDDVAATKAVEKVTPEAIEAARKILLKRRAERVNRRRQQRV